MEQEEKNTQCKQELQCQLDLLKRKLEKEAIVNDEMMHAFLKRKFVTINNNAWVSVFFSILVVLWAIFYLPKQGFSVCFSVATIVMMLVCDFYTWKYHKNVNSKTMNGDMVTVAKVMHQLKQDYQNWIKYGVAMVVVWFVWMTIEFSLKQNDWKIIVIQTVALLIGLGIGGFLGFRMHQSVIGGAEEVIRQIEEK